MLAKENRELWCPQAHDEHSTVRDLSRVEYQYPRDVLGTLTGGIQLQAFVKVRV